MVIQFPTASTVALILITLLCPMFHCINVFSYVVFLTATYFKHGGKLCAFPITEAHAVRTSSLSESFPYFLSPKANTILNSQTFIYNDSSRTSTNEEKCHSSMPMHSLNSEQQFVYHMIAVECGIYLNVIHYF